jgi:hypothetical protein
MDQKAMAALGEEVLVKAVVQTTGTGRSMMSAGMGGAVGGIVGGIAGAAMDRGKHGDLLGHKGRMFMLLGPTKLGFFSFKQGLLKASVGDPIGVLRRDAVRSIELGGGMLTTAFTVHIDDGTDLVLEAPRAEKGKVEQVAAAIGTRPTTPPPPMPDAAPRQEDQA